MAKKKAEHLPELSETLIEPDPNDANATILELDELWSFVLKKVNTSWIWIALCRKTRQIVSYAIGDRSKETCQKCHSHDNLATKKSIIWPRTENFTLR